MNIIALIIIVMAVFGMYAAALARRYKNEIKAIYEVTYYFSGGKDINDVIDRLVSALNSRFYAISLTFAWTWVPYRRIFSLK